MTAPFYDVDVYCSIFGCGQRSFVWYRTLGYCADCAGHMDDARARAGLSAMPWQNEPAAP